MTIDESIKELDERLKFARKEYSGVAIEYQHALITAIECMKKVKAQVHCRDCMHWGTGAAGETDMVKCCEYAKYMVGNNGYCGYAEKKARYNIATTSRSI